MQYGWAIGHPDHSIKETILEHVPIDEIWASGATIQALYADQRSAVGLYTAVIEAMAWEDRWLAVDQLSRFEGDPSWERFPRYWDIEAEFDRDFTFTFDEEVEQELREMIEDLGLVDGLGAEWSFADLEVTW